MTQMVYANALNGRDVESYDETTDTQVTLIRVHTNEAVTPAYLAMRIAEACSSGCLREGESVSADGLTFTIGPKNKLTWPPASE